ncbi:MAG TPA: ATP-binding cassette domain-containing protein [Tepidisphaeraceae bacterium]|jgi:phosphonate C-P lyase system protein PhnK|nr:ATP-binding cassette domain-containing protein [Tepidisphaeraceae bacterium]
MTTMTTPAAPPLHSNRHAGDDPLLLRVRNLSKHYGSAKSGNLMKALDDVTFNVARGETLGIVGESGSGKTTCARAVLRAVDPTAGEALFNNRGRTVDLAKLSHRQLKPLRQEMQMVFQDPFASLNPRMTVGDIIAEPLVIHGIGSKAERRDRVAAMLERVGLIPDHASRYPHAFSGGQRQRVGIARALIMRPALLVADEAVSALDVCVRARVLELLRELRAEFGLTMMFVSHDLSVIRHICDRVMVMYRGRIMEMGDVEQVFNNPQHAYTKVLLSAIPHPDPDRKMQPLTVESLTPEQLQPLPMMG